MPSSACTAGVQWHQWHQNPQQWQVCENILVPNMFFQTPIGESGYKTGRNKRETLVCDVLYVGHKLPSSHKQVHVASHAVKERRTGKTLENSSKIHKVISKIMTYFTDFSKANKIEGREIINSISFLHIKWTYTKSRLRSPVPLKATKGGVPKWSSQQ